MLIHTVSKTEPTNLYRVEAEVPRLFRIKPFAERKRAFERVANVLARKVQQSVTKCSQSFYSPSVQSKPGWNSEASTSSNKDNTTESLHQTPISSQYPDLTPNFGWDTVPLTEKPNQALAVDLLSAGNVPTTPRRLPGTMLPPPVGSERTKLRSAEIASPQMNTSRPLPTEDESVIPEATLTLPALELLRSDFLPAADQWVREQIELHHAETFILDRDEDLLDEACSHAANFGLGGPNLPLNTVHHDALSTKSIFCDVDDQGYVDTEGEAKDNSPSGIRFYEGVQTYEPMIQLLPEIAPPSPLQISFDAPSEADADKMAPRDITESVKKIFTDAGFLTVPNITRHRRWSRTSHTSDVSSMTPSEVSTRASSRCISPDAFSSSDCGDSSSDDTYPESLSDDAFDMESPKGVQNRLAVRQDPVVMGDAVEFEEGDAIQMDVHVKTWLGEQYWDMGDEASGLDRA
jgi:hypothetical protein